MMLGNNDEYDLVSETEVEILLTDLPVDLIKQAISEQVANPLVSSVNYLENVQDRYIIRRQELADDPEHLSRLVDTTLEFYHHVIAQVQLNYNIGLSPDFTDDIDEIMTTATALYEFIVLGYTRNMIKFFTRFISKNKKFILSNITDIDARKKDVSTVSARKKTRNRDDATIIANLPNVLNHIMGLDIDPVEFIELADKNKSYNASVILNMLTSGDIVGGNFVNRYFQLFSSGSSTIANEISLEIRDRIIKKA